MTKKNPTDTRVVRFTLDPPEQRHSFSYSQAHWGVLTLPSRQLKGNNSRRYIASETAVCRRTPQKAPTIKIGRIRSSTVSDLVRTLPLMRPRSNTEPMPITTHDAFDRYTQLPEPQRDEIYRRESISQYSTRRSEIDEPVVLRKLELNRFEQFRLQHLARLDLQKATPSYVYQDSILHDPRWSMDGCARLESTSSTLGIPQRTFTQLSANMQANPNRYV